MRYDKARAVVLRKSGKSYTEISRMLGIPKSTLSEWLSRIKLSVLAQRRIEKIVKKSIVNGLIRRNKNQTVLAIERSGNIRSKSALEIKNLNKETLKFIGVALYWAEGYKRPIKRNGRQLTSHPVALTNSDPSLIKIFLRFLRETCEVQNEKIKADIRIYKHMDERELLIFWRKVTHIPLKNFGKTYYGISKSSLSKRPFNRLPHGTILIRVSDTNLYHKIMGWIDGLSGHDS